MRKDFTFTTEELYIIETAILNYNLILICPRLDFRLVKSQIDYYATDKFIKFVKDSYGYEIDEFLYQLIGWRLLTDFKKFVEYLDNPEEIVKEAMEEKIEMISNNKRLYNFCNNERMYNFCNCKYYENYHKDYQKYLRDLTERYFFTDIIEDQSFDFSIGGFDGIVELRRLPYDNTVVSLLYKLTTLQAVGIYITDIRKMSKTHDILFLEIDSPDNNNYILYSFCNYYLDIRSWLSDMYITFIKHCMYTKYGLDESIKDMDYKVIINFITDDLSYLTKDDREKCVEVSKQYFYKLAETMING